MAEIKDKKPNAWLIALRKWNEGKGSWSMPKKGSKEYEEVRGLMGGGSVQQAPKAEVKEAPKIDGRLRNISAPVSTQPAPIVSADPVAVQVAPKRAKKNAAKPIPLAVPLAPIPVATPVAPKTVKKPVMRVAIEKKNVVLA